MSHTELVPPPRGEPGIVIFALLLMIAVLVAGWFMLATMARRRDKQMV